MHRKLRIVLSCLITLCLTVCMLSYLTTLLERKYGEKKYADFFAQKENFDVLFFGASTVINGVFPMELWEDYGIVSYNFGGHSSQIATSYWVMENALNYTTPRVVVIDCLVIAENLKCSSPFSFVHDSLDHFPLSATKIRAIWDLLNDPAYEEKMQSEEPQPDEEPRSKIGLLWNYSVYHARWGELSQDDFAPKTNVEKGAESRIEVKSGELNRIDRSDKLDGEYTAMRYLRRLIEDCQRRGIDVLLTYMPYPANVWKQREANCVYDLAAEYGLHYINFLDLDVIDYQTDLYDEKFHVNPSGARKITQYLGKYLKENYNLIDQRDNPAYAFWADDYQTYTHFKDVNMRYAKNIDCALMLLARDDVDAVIDLQNTDLLKNPTVLALFANLGVDPKELGPNSDFILVRNGGEAAQVISDFRTDGQIADTLLGTMQLRYASADSAKQETDQYALYLNGKRILESDEREDPGLHILVMRNGDTVADANYICTVSAAANVHITEIIRHPIN